MVISKKMLFTFPFQIAWRKYMADRRKYDCNCYKKFSFLNILKSLMKEAWKEKLIHKYKYNFWLAVCAQERLRVGKRRRRQMSSCSFLVQSAQTRSDGESNTNTSGNRNYKTDTTFPKNINGFIRECVCKSLIFGHFSCNLWATLHSF